MQDLVGVGQLPVDAVIAPAHVGLAGDVAGEQQTGADLVLVEIAQEIDTVDVGGILQGEREAEPGGIAVGGRCRPSFAAAQCQGTSCSFEPVAYLGRIGGIGVQTVVLRWQAHMLFKNGGALGQRQHDRLSLVGGFMSREADLEFRVAAA